MKHHTLFLLLTLVLCLTGCKKSGQDIDASGVFEATEVIVSAKSTGEILQFTAEEGMDVTAGQLLGQIDNTQLTLKKGQLQSTQSATTSRKLDTSAQVASIRQQISNLQREKQRYEELLRDGAATRKQVDEIGYQISVLQKQLAATTEQVSTTNTSIDGQSGSIAAQIDQVDDQIKNAQITSPIDGTILAKYAEQGEYAAPGKALFKVGNLHNMRLRAYITADQLTSLKIGQSVTVYADQGKSGRKAYQGTVTWVSDKAEFTPKTIQTRDERANLVYAIKITVENDGLIKRGMYGDVKF